MGARNRFHDSHEDSKIMVRTSVISQLIYCVNYSCYNLRKRLNDKQVSRLEQSILPNKKGRRAGTLWCAPWAMWELLHLRLRRIKNIGNTFRRESDSPMRPIAERLLVAMPAPAERYDRSTGKVILVSSRVVNLEVPLDAKVPVVVYGDLCAHDTYRRQRTQL